MTRDWKQAFGRIISWLALIGLGPLVVYAVWAGTRLTDGEWLALLAGAWLLGILAVMPHLPPIRSGASRTVINTAFILTSVFALLAAQLVRAQAIHGNETAHRVGHDAASDEVIANPRLVNADLAANRGSILDRNGEVVAETRRAGEELERVYPDPVTAYVAGYYSPLLYGRAGLEASYDEELRGVAGGNAFSELLNDLLGRTPDGHDLRLTLDADLQRAAHQLLNGRPGAVVLIDIRSGAILTLASNPQFDPNRLDVLSQDDRDAAIAYWSDLNDDPARPLVLRATGGLFTPGSTFKIVTAAAAIDAGTADPDTVYQDNGLLDVDGHVIIEYNRPDDSVVEWTLTEGLAYSLNVVFARVGLELGGDRLTRYAERFGLERALPFDLPVATSQIASSDDFLAGDPALADTSFGQGQLQVTPLQMALIVAAVANDGKMMAPYLVDRVLDGDGDALSQRDARLLGQPVSTETAEQVQAMMINAVETGYVSGARIPGLTVGGKTGTAETSQDLPHSWFIGFVGDPEPQYAVAVVLEHGGNRTSESIAIGREMLRAAMALSD